MQTLKRYGKKPLITCLWWVRCAMRLVYTFEERVILTYHSVSGSDAPATVSPEQFKQHIEYFLAKGYTFIWLADVIDWMDKKRGLPKQCVALTFDDGYEDFMTAVLPILEQHTIPATVFMVGDREKSRPTLGNDIPLLSDTALEHLVRHELVELGYHALTHANLTLCTPEQLHDECIPYYFARFFAYPGGQFDPTVMAEVTKAGYAAAFTIKPYLLTQKHDRFSLPRVVITGDLALWEVAMRASKAINWHRAVKRLFGIW